MVGLDLTNHQEEGVPFLFGLRRSPSHSTVNHLGFEYLVQPQPKNYLRLLRIRFLRVLYRNRTNSPFISGDSIASICDYYAFGKNGTSPIDIERLRAAKSIFVAGHRLEELLEQFGDEICAFTLVSGNSDENFVKTPHLPDSVQLFLCQNSAIQGDERVHTLPIGLENMRLGRSGIPGLHKFQNQHLITNRVFIPPMSPTNSIRKNVMLFAQRNPNHFDVGKNYLPEKRYFDLVHRYRYIFACEGNGFENHRIWEALYSGSFPVMLISDWSKSLMEYELPILFVEDIQEINQALLQDFSNRHQNFNPADCEALWISYWEELVKEGKFRKPKKLEIL